MKEEIISVKKPFRLYVNNEWVHSYETESEALNGLDKWIVGSIFDDVFVCKILRMKKIRNV